MAQVTNSLFIEINPFDKVELDYQIIDINHAKIDAVLYQRAPNLFKVEQTQVATLKAFPVSSISVFSLANMAPITFNGARDVVMRTFEQIKNAYINNRLNIGLFDKNLTIKI